MYSKQHAEITYTIITHIFNAKTDLWPKSEVFYEELMALRN